MANVAAFQAFLKERQTGLIQRSEDWVKARQNTIGASEISALTGSFPFDNQSSLLRKKIRPVDMCTNVACIWGTLFEPFARAYFEWEHNNNVFGYNLSLNLAKDHPLYCKGTCSTDGYFKPTYDTIALLEFKCPYKRKIVVHKTPAQYRDQLQTGLALSGEWTTKGLFVDTYFRMCSLGQLGMNLAHNAALNGGVVHKTKTPFPRAWGICFLRSKTKLNPKQTQLLDLGGVQSKLLFADIMFSIKKQDILVDYPQIRVVYDQAAKKRELANLRAQNAYFRQATWGRGEFYPVAFFAWKLLDITEIWEDKQPNFLEAIQDKINSFHKNLERQKALQANPVKTIPNTLKDDSVVMQDFFEGQLSLIENFPPLCTQQWRKQAQHQ